VVGYSDGLPGHAVWSLASVRDGNALWVGTDRGLAHFTPAPPLMQPIVRRFDVGRWPARAPVADVLPTLKGFWMADDRGVHRFGVPHRYAQNMDVAAPEQMRALLEDGRVLWAVGRWEIVRMDRRGRLRRAQSRVAIRDATWFRGSIWFISEYGLHRLAPDDMSASLVLERAGFTRLVAGKRSMWAVVDGIPVAVVGGTTRPFMRASAVLDLAPAGDVVCLGTADGLEVMFPDGEVVDVLGESDAREMVSAVASDGPGACWFATSTGKVGRTGADDQVRMRTLPLESDAEIHRLVPDGDWAWILTNQGTWRVHIGSP
jgi:ligand-binding sensor domain-containing protein